MTLLLMEEGMDGLITMFEIVLLEEWKEMETYIGFCEDDGGDEK